MLDALKTLFENDVVSEDVRAQIEEAWESKVKENYRQATAELREEFAQKYEHDKQNMVEAVDRMVSERLDSEIQEFAEDRKSLAEAKAKYTVATRKHGDLLQNFVQQQLGSEISELHNDRKAQTEKFARLENFVVEALSKELVEFSEDKKELKHAKSAQARRLKETADLMKNFVQSKLAEEIAELHEDKKQIAGKVGKMEEFVVEALAQELQEFHTDKVELAETRVRLIKEAKSNLGKLQRRFVKSSARTVKETVNKTLKREIAQLREDIDSARKNDFGRRLFEAFAGEYSTSYLNEKSETARLAKLISAKDNQLAEAKKLAEKARSLAEAQQRKNQHLLAESQRKETIDQLLEPLSKAQKSIMKDLLESVQTPKLQSAFDKYLPAVIDGNTPAKQKAPLIEGKEITGNRDNSVTQTHADDGNVVDLRRLAGIN